MSNRTDFDAVARELGEMFGLARDVVDRIETELHDAYVAGEEGHGCACSSCRRARNRPGTNGISLDDAMATARAMLPRRRRG